MPSGNLQIVNASQEDEGMYKCAAYNPVTQEVKTSGSSDRLRVRRKGQGLADGRGGLGVPQFMAQLCVLRGGSEGCWARTSGTLKTQDSARVGGPGWGGSVTPPSPSAASHNPTHSPRTWLKRMALLPGHLAALWGTRPSSCLLRAFLHCVTSRVGDQLECVGWGRTVWH